MTAAVIFLASFAVSLPCEKDALWLTWQQKIYLERWIYVGDFARRRVSPICNRALCKRGQEPFHFIN